MPSIPASRISSSLSRAGVLRDDVERVLNGLRIFLQMAGHQLVAGAEADEGKGREHVVDDHHVVLQPGLHGLRARDLLADEGGIRPQRLHVVPVLRRLDRLGDGVRVVEIAVAHDLHHVDVDVVVVVQVRLDARLAYALIGLKVKPEAYGRPVDRQVVQGGQDSFTLVHKKDLL